MPDAAQISSTISYVSYSDCCENNTQVPWLVYEALLKLPGLALFCCRSYYVYSEARSSRPEDDTEIKKIEETREVYEKKTGKCVFYMSFAKTSSRYRSRWEQF